MRLVSLFCLLLLLGACSAPTLPISVSAPKVFGDDQALRYLDARLRELTVDDLDAADDRPQVVNGASESSTRARRLRVNLTEPGAGPLTGLQRFRRPFGLRRRRGFRPRVELGLSAAERLRRRAELSRLRGAYELLYQGDRGLTRPDARALLVRFEVSVQRQVDLGDERRYALVEFEVRDARGPLKGARVYLLSPELSALVERESLLEAYVKESGAELLGTAGGIGLSGGFASRDAVTRRFAALLETPLSFAIYDGARKGARFGFAFGPRRRLAHRSLLNPSRWFGSEYELRYVLQPGPRACLALLVFDRPPPDGVVIRVRHGERLLGEHELSGRAALPIRAEHEVAFPERGDGPRLTSQLDLVPRTGSTLLLVADRIVFTPQSTVFVGPVAIPQDAVRVLGRGRLEVAVDASPALEALRKRGVREVQGRVLTPDQKPALFPVRLLPETRSH